MTKFLLCLSFCLILDGTWILESDMLNISILFIEQINDQIGRLPMEWSKCLTPLVNSSKVKVLGRCVAAPTNLQLMQEIMLYLRYQNKHFLVFLFLEMFAMCPRLLFLYVCLFANALFVPFF